MKVLVIAAHPDDEILGCGGTLARHVMEGDEVNIVIVAEGATSRQDEGRENVTALRQAASDAAVALGAQPPVFLGLLDNRLDSVDLLDIVQAIEEQARSIQPEIIYTHHGSDLNLDHHVVNRAAITAFRPLPGHTIRAIYAYETLSSTEWGTGSTGPAFRPQHFVDITETLDTKMKALDCYQMEMRAFPHPRSNEAVTSLAKLRGSHAGVLAAEAFEVILEIR